MGTVVVSIGIGDPQGRRFEDVEAIVDTGSTFTAIPRTTLQRLGVAGITLMWDSPNWPTEATRRWTSEEPWSDLKDGSSPRR